MATTFEAITRIDEADEMGADASVFPEETPNLESEDFWESNIAFSEDFLPDQDVSTGEVFDSEVTVSLESQGKATQQKNTASVFIAKMRVSDIFDVEGNRKVGFETMDCEQYVYDLSLPLNKLPSELAEIGTHCYVAYRIFHQ